MKKIYFLSFLLLQATSLLGQNHVNDWLAALKQAKADSQKVGYYEKIISYYGALKPDSENWYVNDGINYFSKHGYKLGVAQILYHAGIADENHGRVDLAKERTTEALKIFQEQRYLKGIAESLHNLGATEAGKGNFDVAFKYFISALKVYDSVTDNHGLMLTYMNMSNLYLEHADTINAWKYLMDADSTSRKTPLSDASIFLYNNIGVMYVEKGRPDTAIKIFLNNLQLSDKPEFIESHIECLLYISNFYADNGTDEESLKYLNEGLGIAKKYNSLEMESNFLLGIAQIKEKTDASSAIKYLDTAKAICEKIESKEFLASIYGEMAKVYKQEGNYKDALVATEQKQKIIDSILSIDKTKEIENINAAYELEKNKKIKQLEDLNNKNIAKRNAIIVVTVIIILIFFVLLFYYRKTIILNRRLVLREKQLGELNAMKDKLFSIIGHDLRSPLAQIPAVLDIYEDPGTTDIDKKFMLDSLKEHSNASLETLDKLLLWGQSLMKGIAITPVKLHTKKLIKENIELKKTAAAEKKITIIDNTAADITVYSDATHFDFIIRNLIANAIKFTHRDGRVEINADKNSRAGFVVFEVKDNGIGIEKPLLDNIFNPLSSREGTANEKGAGIGLMLCKEFAARNGGDIWVQSTPGKGSSFYFSVKSIG